MRLSLSSAAAPDASLAELLAASVRRGFGALELDLVHSHGVNLESAHADLDAARSQFQYAGIEICGISGLSLERSDVCTAVDIAADLEAPLILREDLLSEAAGGRAELLTRHRTDVEQVQDLVEKYDLGLAWDFRPEEDDPGAVPEVIAAAGSRLKYVRLYGGGPEAARQEGHGVGAFMARLTLARYGGPLVLTPSTTKYHYAWGAWLGRAGGWGCGSKTSDPSLVTLSVG